VSAAVKSRKGPRSDAAQRNAERKAKMGELKAMLAAWEGSADELEVAAVLARFGGYSPRNAKLIAAQRPDATVVAGFREWLAQGRAVRKGEHGIKILAPSRYAADAGEDESSETAGEASADHMRFVFVTVFDIAQTDALEDRDRDREQVPA
jgi:N-terminal domain of anti-restriction factor ArdC